MSILTVNWGKEYWIFILCLPLLVKFWEAMQENYLIGLWDFKDNVVIIPNQPLADRIMERLLSQVILMKFMVTHPSREVIT